MRVALVGARGHGAWHLANAVRLAKAGRITFVGVCEVAEVDAPVAVYRDLDELLADQRPEVVVLSTPPHTHRQLALTALEAGCDLLIEKPAVLSQDDFDAIGTVADAKGLVCQVGFQSQGKGSFRRLVELIGAGDLGELHGIGAAGRWVRDDAYYARAPWAGQRSLDGAPVLDGTLSNPFAHAVQNALLLADVEQRADLDIELRLLRNREANEADDTSCLRVLAFDAPPVVVATTLCADVSQPPYLIVHGSRGQALLWYDDDRLEVNGHEMAVPGTVDLLENLVDHRMHGSPLLAPLAASRAFTSVVEAIGNTEVELVAERWRHRDDDRVILDGVDDAVVRAAEKLATFDELGLGWAR